jgi:hypothetical protein
MLHEEDGEILRALAGGDELPVPLLFAMGLKNES